MTQNTQNKESTTATIINICKENCKPSILCRILFVITAMMVLIFDGATPTTTAILVGMFCVSHILAYLEKRESNNNN